MSGATYIGAALTLGGAIIAMSVLSSDPSEARRAHVKKGHFIGAKAFHRPGGKTVSKTHHATHKRTSGEPIEVPGKPPQSPGIGKLPPSSSQSNPTKAADVAKGPPDASLAQDGPTPFPTPTTSTKSPKELVDWAGTRSPKLPPIVSSEPLPPKGGTKLPPVVGSEPIEPGTFDPGKLPPPPPGGKLPPVVSGEPIQPGTFDPGKLPPPPGGELPPIVSSEPLPGPFDPGNKAPGSGGYIPPVVVIGGGGSGGDKGLPGPAKGDGIPVNGPASDYCDPCEWLKLNYDQTGLARWLERYRLCLTWLRPS